MGRGCGKDSLIISSDYRSPTPCQSSCCDGEYSRSTPRGSDLSSRAKKPGNDDRLPSGIVEPLENPVLRPSDGIDLHEHLSDPGLSHLGRSRSLQIRLRRVADLGPAELFLEYRNIWPPLPEQIRSLRTSIRANLAPLGSVPALPRASRRSERLSSLLGQWKHLHCFPRFSRI